MGTLRTLLNADRMSRGLAGVEDINDRAPGSAEGKKDLTYAINLIGHYVFLKARKLEQIGALNIF